MLPSSNTPPDGDFVRYIEQLTAASEAAARRVQASQPPHAGGRISSTAAPAAPLLSRKPAPQQLASPAKPGVAVADWLGHLKWLVVLWIATQVLGEILPGAGWLFVPALFAYLGWIVFSVNRQSSGALLARLRQLAEEAQKHQQLQQKNRK
jgi:hypothetical protein